jgi:Ion channel/Pentapeptide repeats (8 copies)
MRPYSEFLPILKKHGYDATTNACDYYFEHRRELDPLLFGPAVASDEFALKVRWKSVRGIACVAAVKDYLQKKMEANEKATAQWFREDHQRMMTDSNYYKSHRRTPDMYATIDFEDFQFNFDGQSWTLSEFTYSFQTGRISPQKDLIGIDLSGIHLRNCRLVNLCFSQACFDNADFFQIELINTNFPQASFRDARLMTIQAKKGAYFNGADMTNTGVFGIHPLSDQTLTAPIQYTEISYWRLLVDTFKAVARITSRYAPGWKVGAHTSFMNNTVTGLTLPETRSIKEYITWYQFTMGRIANLRRMPILSQIGFVLSVIGTKHWTSYRALAGVALVIDLIFAIFFQFASRNFLSEGSTFLDCFYASTLIFTTLGVEGIKPATHLGQIAILVEALTGYLILALFVFLLARKVEWKY